jgi:hypothetical protein
LLEQLHAKPKKSWLGENGRRKHCRGTKSWIINLKEMDKNLVPGGGGGGAKRVVPLLSTYPPNKISRCGQNGGDGTKWRKREKQNGAKEKNKMAPNKVEDDNLQVLISLS